MNVKITLKITAAMTWKENLLYYSGTTLYMFSEMSLEGGTCVCIVRMTPLSDKS